MATTVPTLQNFIDSEAVDPAEGQTEEILNPATGEVIANAPLSTAEDVERAVDEFFGRKIGVQPGVSTIWCVRMQ